MNSDDIQTILNLIMLALPHAVMWAHERTYHRRKHKLIDPARIDVKPRYPVGTVFEQGGKSYQYVYLDEVANFPDESFTREMAAYTRSIQPESQGD